MKSKTLWLTILASALVTGLLAWLVPTAQGAPALYVIRWVDGATGFDAGDCNTSPCATIGYAIAQSGSSDVIYVASGTYTEHITMKNGASIYGQGWDKTIINGNFSTNQSTVYIPSGVSASTVLSGVQVTGGGTGDPNTSANGGGIRIRGSPSIVNTWVNNNTGSYGGGIEIQEGSPTLTNVPVWSNRALSGGGLQIWNNAVVTITSDMIGTNGTVWWNSASLAGGGIYIQDAAVNVSGLHVWWNSAPQGGGIYAVTAPSLLIQGNTIVWNTSRSGGGGVYLNHSGGSFEDNVLIGNVVTDTGSMGGGAFLTGSLTGMKVERNWFEANSAVLVGGGLHLQNGAVALVNANTIVTNTAYGGGGVSIESAGMVTFTNNIVARNAVSSTNPTALNIYGTAARVINNTIADNPGPGPAVYLHTADGVVVVNNIISGNGSGIYRAEGTMSTYTADYNDVYANSVQNYYYVTPGPHDVSISPGFVGSGNMLAYYHLQATSPVGKNGSFAYAPAYDIDGNPRISFISMGADQILPNLYLPLIRR